MRKNRISFFILILFFSCDFPEHYFSPEPICQSEVNDDLKLENQALLIEKLKSKQPKDYRYFFKTFEEEGRDVYMITNFRNDQSCFDIKILVENWDKLAGMKRTNGYSYPKELYDLKWKITKTANKDEVIYQDMHKIID